MALLVAHHHQTCLRRTALSRLERPVSQEGRADPLAYVESRSCIDWCLGPAPLLLGVLPPPYWRGDEGEFSSENWPWVGESVAHFNRSHWLAKVVIRPLQVVVKLAKMLIDGFIIPGVVLFYCMARVFLVVECFITLEHLPASVYNVPLWSNYLPHIS